MTEEEQKQQLSIAYVHAVAACCGYACERPLVDDDSVDAVIAAAGKIHRRSILKSPRLELQLKGTSQNFLKEDHLAFPLPIKNYNDLRGQTLVPRLLVVLFLPERLDQRLEQDEDRMISRHCAYWISLRGLPKTDNREKTTVHLPRSQCFTVASLKELMQRVSRGETP